MEEIKEEDTELLPKMVEVPLGIEVIPEAKKEEEGDLDKKDESQELALQEPSIGSELITTQNSEQKQQGAKEDKEEAAKD